MTHEIGTQSSPDTAAPASRYRLATLLVLATAVVNSVGGVMVRSVEQASDLQIVFYRGASLFVALSLIFLIQHRSATLGALRRSFGWSLLGGLFLGGASTCLVVSMTSTTIANTTFVLSAIPFLTACLAWLVLGERVRGGTWAAMGLAVVGIAVMAWDGFEVGAQFGNAMALAAATLFSCFVVVLRRGRANDMLPATIIGSASATLLAWLLSGGDLSINGPDLTVCIFWGSLSSVVHALFVFGSRYVRGAELTLLILIEFALAPVWVWLLFDEIPTDPTLIGGLLVLGAVTGWALAGLRSRQASLSL